MKEEHIKLYRKLGSVHKSTLPNAYIKCIRAQLDTHYTQEELTTVLWDSLGSFRRSARSKAAFIFRICLPEYEAVLNQFWFRDIDLETAMRRVKIRRAMPSKEELYQNHVDRLVKFSIDRMEKSLYEVQADIAAAFDMARHNGR